MTADPADARPRRRLAARLSVGASMLLVAAVAVGLGWATRPARRQRRAVEAIRASGGDVLYDDQYVNGVPAPAAPPRVAGPDWLRRAIGDDYVRTARSVTLRPGVPGRLSADLMGRAGDLDRVETLTIEEGLAVDDAGLARLVGMGSLKRLSVRDASGVIGPGFDALGGLGAVERVDLSRAVLLTDAGLAAIGRLPGLKALSVSSAPRVTDAGVAALAAASSPTSLALVGTPNLTDEALKSIATMTGLTAIILMDDAPTGASPRPAGGGRITDAGIGRLARLPSLTQLVVTGTEATGRGLRAALDNPRMNRIILESRGPMLGGLDGPPPASTLWCLWLTAPDLGDEAAGKVAGWSGLRSLMIRGRAGPSDRSIDVAARGLPGLTSLYLGSLDPDSREFGAGSITDAGLAGLARLPALGLLDLRGALPGPLSPAGLAALRSIPGLRSVSLTTDQIRPADLAALRRTNPGLRVTTWPPPRSGPPTPTRAVGAGATAGSK